MREIYIVCEKDSFPMMCHFTDADIKSTVKDKKAALDFFVSCRIDKLKEQGYTCFVEHPNKEAAEKDFENRSEYFELIKDLA